MQAATVPHVSRFERALSQLLAAMAEPGAEWPDVHSRILCAFPGLDGGSLADAYDAATAGDAPLTAAELATADQLTRALTAFEGLADMLGAFPTYRPSLHCSRRNPDPGQRAQLLQLANLYDRAQAARGDERRAYRY